MNGMNGAPYVKTKIELEESTLLALITAILSVGHVQDPSVVIVRAKKILEEVKKNGQR